MSTPNLLCIGLNPAIDTTISLEKLATGMVNRAISTHSEPAGKGLNVATIASQLKARSGGGGVAKNDNIGAVWLSGFLGCDNDSDFLAKFEKFSIKNHCISVAGSTRQNIKLVEQNGTTTDVNGVGFTLASSDKAKFFERIADDVLWSDFVVVCGSLPQGFSLADFEKLLGIIASSGKKWAVDTSGEALALAVKYRPFLIKPNEYEFAELVAKPCESLEDELAALSALHGVANVVLSMGDKGVHWYGDGKLLQATAPKVAVKSTVGAGDTLLSALVYGILTEQEPHKNLAQAVALAGYKVSQVGFELGDEQTLTALMAQVEISEFTL